MVKTRLRRRLLLTLVLLLVIVTGGVVAKRVHQRRLHALFEGACQESTGPSGGTCPVVAYQTRGPLAEDAAAGRIMGVGGASLLDKPDDEDERWEGWVDMAHGEFGPDATTHATRLARVRSRSVYRAPRRSRFLTVTYPPDNALFPSNLCAPSVEWSDGHNNFWQVTLYLPDADDALKFLTDTPRWRVPDDVWERLKTSAVAGRRARLELRGVDRTGLWSTGRPGVHRSKPVRFAFAADAVDNAIVYRAVAPPFHRKKTPDLFVRDVRRRKPTCFLSARQQYCLNCHTFSAKSGTSGKLALQVRYTGNERRKHYTYLAVFDLDTQRGRKTILPFEMQMTTFMAWSPASGPDGTQGAGPSGTRLVFSANQSIWPFYPIVFETQSVGQPTSDLAVYDTTTETVGLVAGASDPDLIEIYPAWTPDGEAIVFSRAAPTRHPIWTQFEIWEIPYKRRVRGRARRVCDATGEPIGWIARDAGTGDGSTRREKQSSFYARFSPDGKWLSWVQADYGSLIKASSDIYIMRWQPRGKVIRLRCNARHAADSWHTWSSNSRWIAFATKREDGVYARVYMTHIDADGRDSPAVRLPMTDPLLRVSFNLPEFLSEVPTIYEPRLFENIGVEAEVFHVKSDDPRANE